MHQPEVVHYIATVDTLNLFQRSFVSLSAIKILIVFSEVAITVRTHLFSLRLMLFCLELELIGTYPHVKWGLIVPSHIINVVCVNFIREEWDLQFKVKSE